MSSSVIDTRFLIHVGTELIVIGGLTFWLNRKINGVSEQVTILQNKLTKYEEIIERQNQLLMRHEQAIRAIFGEPPLPRPQGGQQRSPQGGQGPQSQLSQDNPPQSNKGHSHGSPQGGHQREHQKERQEDVSTNKEHKDSEVDNPNDNQLDSLLSEELSQIKQSRHIEVSAPPEDDSVRAQSKLKKRQKKDKVKTKHVSKRKT